MKIKQEVQIPEVKIQTEETKNLIKKVLIGPTTGSNNIIMRYFKVLPNGYTPRHKHNYEHLVKIERGKGIAINEDGNEYEVSLGQSIFVEPNKKHQFKNPFSEPFEFICIIPNPERDK